MFWKRGPDYHWIVDLYNRLQLEIPDALQENLTTHNIIRKRDLEYRQTEKSKSRRIQQRRSDAGRRNEWTKRNGDDVYGEESTDEATESKTNAKAPAKFTEQKCRSCGQVGHLTNRSKKCLNYKNTLPSCAKASIDDANQVDLRRRCPLLCYI